MPHCGWRTSAGVKQEPVLPKVGYLRRIVRGIIECATRSF